MEPEDLAAILAALQAETARHLAITKQIIAESDKECRRVRANQQADLTIIDRACQQLAESWALISSAGG